MRIDKIESIDQNNYKIFINNKQGLISSKKNLGIYSISRRHKDFLDYCPERSCVRSSDGREFKIKIPIKPKYDLVSNIIGSYYLIRSGIYVSIFDITSMHETKLPDNISEVYLEWNNTLSCRINGKWGLYSLTGKEIIPPNYNKISWENPYFCLLRNGKTILYNFDTGEFLPTEYSVVKGYQNNILFVKNPQKQGLLFPSGEMIPAKRYEIHQLDEQISLIDIDSKKGVISAEGRLIIFPNYDSLHSIGSQDIFVVSKNNKYGLLSIKAGVLVEPKYSCFKLVEGEELLYVKEKNKWGLIDFSGKIILSPRYDSKTFPRITYLFRDKTSGRIYLNPDNNRIFSEREETGRKLDFSWYVLRRENQSVLFNEKGTVCQVFPQQDLVALRKNAFLFRENKRWGVVTFDGVVIIQPQFDEITTCGEKAYSVRLGEKWGIISVEGIPILNVSFDEVLAFEKQTYKIKNDTKWGIVHFSGRMILEPLYDQIEKGNDKAFRIKHDMHWGLLSTERWQLMPLCYETIESIPGYMFKFLENGKWGVIDENENEILSPIYDDVTFYSGNKFTVILRGQSGSVDIVSKKFIPEKKPFKKNVTGSMSGSTKMNISLMDPADDSIKYDFSSN